LVRTPIRILELRSVRGTGGGPEKTILFGAARTDPLHFAVTVCYIRDERDTVFSVGSRAAQHPIDYVEIAERHSLDLSIWPALRRIVRERRIDIVHSHDYKTNLFAFLLSKAEPVIPLSTVHGWTGHTLREKIYYCFDKRILSLFPKAIAVSNQIRAELIRAGAHSEKVPVILNGIDSKTFQRDRSRELPERQAYRLSPEDVVIGGAGRLEPQKRFDLLIEAFAQLRRDKPRLRLLIAGDGQLRPKLQALIDRLSLHDECKLIGHCADIAGVHHAFDLFVQSSDYEGTPNAVLEAMAMQTPIVATDAGGTRELVQHGVHALLVPPGNSALLAEVIRHVLDDGQGSARRATAARARIEEQLSFEARMRAIESIYEELVNEKTRRNGCSQRVAEVLSKMGAQ